MKQEELKMLRSQCLRVRRALTNRHGICVLSHYTNCTILRDFSEDLTRTVNTELGYYCRGIREEGPRAVSPWYMAGTQVVPKNAGCVIEIEKRHTPAWKRDRYELLTLIVECIDELLKLQKS